MTEFNILGKVDSSRTLVTPDAFTFRMKEALGVSNADFAKFKAEVLKEKNVSEPSEWQIDQEKKLNDEKFQALCKDLWPNIYNKIEATEQPKCVNANELLSELEKKKAFYDSIIKQDLKDIQTLTVIQKQQPAVPESFTRMDQLLKGSPTSPSINVYINDTRANPVTVTPQAAPPPPPTPAPAISEIIMSSYNYPFCTSKYSEMRNKKYPYENCYSSLLGMSVVDKSLISSDDEKLLKSIEETQEKLKIAQKVEASTELVDELIAKFKHLQTQMKKKKTEIDLKIELDSLKQARDFSRCFTSLTDDEEFNKVFTSTVHHNRPCRSDLSPCRSRSSSRRSRCRDREMRSCSRSCSREPPVSIMKKRVKCVRSKSPGVTFRLKETTVSPCRSSVTASSETYGSRDYFYVAPKVDCWNRPIKKDRNVY